MQQLKPSFVIDLESANLDSACSRKLWFHKYHREHGITANTALLSNEMYQATLSDMRTIALMQDISQAAIQEMIDDVLLSLVPADLTNTRAMELLYRRLGWLAAYALFVEPQIRKIYRTIDIAEESYLDRDSLRILLPTSGRLLQHRNNHQIEHRDFVQTGTINAKWRDGWQWNIRPHLSLLAIRESLSMKVDFARITGLATGFVPALPNPQLHHPYVYAYFNVATHEWTHQFKLKDEDGGTWKERPVWEFHGSLTDWVIRLGSTIAEQQFPLSPKIPLNGRIVEEWLARRLHRERHLHAVKTVCQTNLAIRNLHFPMQTDQCAPVHTAPCPYKDLCWSEPFMSAALTTTHFTLNTAPPEAPSSASATRPLSWLSPPTETLSERIEAAIDAGRASVVEGFVPCARPVAPLKIALPPSLSELPY